MNHKYKDVFEKCVELSNEVVDVVDFLNDIGKYIIEYLPNIGSDLIESSKVVMKYNYELISMIMQVIECAQNEEIELLKNHIDTMKNFLNNSGRWVSG